MRVFTPVDGDSKTSHKAVGIDRNDAAKLTDRPGGGGACPGRLYGEG